MRSQFNGCGNSFSNGPGTPPLTITGVQCGAAQDDRWGNGPNAATA
jgi:hypothetical protein